MLYLIRGIFLALVAVVALAYLLVAVNNSLMVYYIMIGGVIAAFGVIAVDVALPQKNLTALSGVIFGVLVGVLMALCVGYLVDQVAHVFLLRDVSSKAAAAELPAGDLPEVHSPAATAPADARREELKEDPNISYNRTILNLLQGLKLLLGLIITYISVSFILQTKDDFRFIIPYVEFSRATKGPRPLILDTSVIIDGRVADMAATGMFESPLVVPRFVLNELQTIADSGDHLKRRRGRRGLEVLEKLKELPKLELRFWDGTLTNMPEGEGVDQKLVALAQQERGRLVTNDYNLNKIAGLRGVDVVNINSIADALKPVVLPGEMMKVRVVKPGENSGQGVGYLEDGTMVVVEGARDRVGVEVELVVTNVIQNPAGKMIFGRVDAHSDKGSKGPKPASGGAEPGAKA
jgi:uncharacterized protein YacL